MTATISRRQILSRSRDGGLDELRRRQRQRQRDQQQQHRHSTTSTTATTTKPFAPYEDYEEMWFTHEHLFKVK